jgi:hypothetical protein
MNNMKSNPAETLRNLDVVFHQGVVGPYSEEQVLTAERAIGRRLDEAHRQMLLSLGANFGFADGAANLGGTNFDVRKFLGVGQDDYDLVGWLTDYAGQIPPLWYPVALDFDTGVYLLAPDGAVYFVPLDEKLWSLNERPTTSGEKVANSFMEFVRMLRPGIEEDES